MENQVEELTEALLCSMEEQAPLYGIEMCEIPRKDFMMQVVATLINEGIIKKEE